MSAQAFYRVLRVARASDLVGYAGPVRRVGGSAIYQAITRGARPKRLPSNLPALTTLDLFGASVVDTDGSPSGAANVRLSRITGTIGRLNVVHAYAPLDADLEVLTPVSPDPAGIGASPKGTKRVTAYAVATSGESLRKTPTFVFIAANGTAGQWHRIRSIHLTRTGVAQLKVYGRKTPVCVSPNAELYAGSPNLEFALPPSMTRAQLDLSATLYSLATMANREDETGTDDAALVRRAAAQKARARLSRLGIARTSISSADEAITAAKQLLRPLPPV